MLQDSIKNIIMLNERQKI